MRCIHATIFAVEKQYGLCILRVSVALGIWPAMDMRHIVVRGPPGSIVFFYIIS
jgi:hypothetical protein